MKSNFILRITILLCAILIIPLYFGYRPDSWPGGTESLACIGSFVFLIFLLTLLWAFRDMVKNEWIERSISSGLWIGLLWSVEIGINNFFHPDLPLRDYIDDIFWAVIALLILIVSFRESYKSKKISRGLMSGIWSGTASGAVACLSALLLIVFGLRFVLDDPLNIKEWSELHTSSYSANMAVYFVYQTFTGAIMHLYILGALMGLILGVLGGLAGRILQKT